MIVGIDEQVQMRSKLVVAVIVVALDRRVLDRAVHPLILFIGPRMVHFGQPMSDGYLVADAVEDVLTIVDILPTLCELNAIVCDHGVNSARHSFDEVAQELSGFYHAGAFHRPYKDELAGSVNDDEQSELARSRTHLGDVDVDVADSVSCKALRLGFVSGDLG